MSRAWTPTVVGGEPERPWSVLYKNLIIRVPAMEFAACPGLRPGGDAVMIGGRLGQPGALAVPHGENTPQMLRDSPESRQVMHVGF